MNCKSLAFICGFRGRGLVINIIFNNTDFCILGYYPMSDKLKNIHRIFFNKYPKKKTVQCYTTLRYFGSQSAKSFVLNLSECLDK